MVQDRYRGRPSPGAELSALHGTRQGFQDPLAAALRTHTNLAHAKPLHGQSILEVLRMPPPRSRRTQRHQRGTRHLGRHTRHQRSRAHSPAPCRRTLPACPDGPGHEDLHHLPGQRRARCVPDGKVIGGESRSPADTPYQRSPAAGQVRTPSERSLQARVRVPLAPPGTTLPIDINQLRMTPTSDTHLPLTSARALPPRSNLSVSP